MDACLQKFETSMGSASVTPTSSEKVIASTHRRVAHWDNMREKCSNCEHIYLKTLSRHVGFCSVDCKSNMIYLEKVNRTIRAMKEAVDERRSTQEQALVEELKVQQEPQVDQQSKLQSGQASSQDDVSKSDASHSLKHAQSFAEFDVESRVLDASNVNWSFSAVY
ncbi:unnamed protein product [Peronospora farinosa]|uniref:FLZ-type domain-containing protein n=1 Tax=Peronospora farinosa TaxID=134698 RepID=A0AAV0SNY3_9STRA|nr:unnamed protein product [Peronospora farinosa]CAI5704589.1 unnamed protein product [Peronospora farinosa]